MSMLRRHGGTAGLVVAVVALVAALAGGAIAASGGGGAAVSAKKKKASKGPTGPRGPARAGRARGRSGAARSKRQRWRKRIARYDRTSRSHWPCWSAHRNAPEWKNHDRRLELRRFRRRRRNDHLFLPIQAGVTYTQADIVLEEEGGGGTTDCPGTVEEPKAASGKLCIYVLFSEGPVSSFPAGGVWPVSMTTGVSVHFQGVLAAGTWAVKAP